MGKDESSVSIFVSPKSPTHCSKDMCNLWYDVYLVFVRLIGRHHSLSAWSLCCSGITNRTIDCAEMV